MRKLIQTILALLRLSALLTIGCAYAAAADHALPPGPYVSTSGEAHVEQMPDYVTITVNISGEGETAEQARDALDAVATGLNAVLERFAAALGERRLRMISVSPKFRRMDGGEQQRVGYRAEQSVEIRVDDLNRLNPLYYDLAALDTAGLSTPTYAVADESNIRERARGLALENALRNAQMLATSQGARLGAVWGVIYRPMHENAARFSTGTEITDYVRIGAGLARSRSLTIPLEPQPIPYSATVGVIYRLEMDAPGGDGRDE